MPTDSKQRIEITRNSCYAEMFDQMPSLGDEFWLTLLCRGGSLIYSIHVDIDYNHCLQPPLPKANRWYRQSLLKTLVLVSGAILAHIFKMLFSKKMVSHLQNAWETNRPNEMLSWIYLAMPPGTVVDDPTEDAALLARIGAECIRDDSGVKYELKNATTGTRFMFEWHKFYGNEYWHWIRKITETVKQ